MREVMVMAKKKAKQRAWLPSSGAGNPTLGADVKAQVESKAKDFIDKVLKPKHVKPPPKEARNNYLTDITLKWHGSTLFLVAVYACPGPNAISPTFEDRFARLRPAASGRFDLSYLRHTGQWVELYQGQTVEECLEAIRDDPWFMP
jgi:hypothetical protein